MKLLEYQPREFALQLHNSDKRWMVLVCHRRAGKTVAACVDLLIGALETKRSSPQFAYLAPFRQQAKTVAWSYLKDLSREYWAQPPNESELTVFIKSAGGVAKIFVAGADNPDSLQQLGARRIFAKTNTTNTRSQRVLLKQGMTHYKFKPQDLRRYDGTIIDMDYFELTKEQWRTHAKT